MGYVKICVPYDNGYWDMTVKPSLTYFFDDNIILEILTERIKTSTGYGTCSESSDCDSETSVASNRDSDTGSENACDSQLQTSAADVSSIDVDIASESQLKAIKHSKNGSDNEGLTWTLGCKNNCKDASATNVLKVTGQLVMPILCAINKLGIIFFVKGLDVYQLILKRIMLAKNAKISILIWKISLLKRDVIDINILILLNMDEF